MFEPCVQIKEFMKNYPGHWWIAGGWAIDLHRGEEIREHGDIGVAVLRDEQHLLRSLLKDWKVQYIKEGSGINWREGVWLNTPVHEIHSTNHSGEHIEFLLNERKREHWHFRRDSNIKFPLSHMNLCSEQGIPYLNPEIVLLYKAKHSSEKDNQDFHFIFPHLNERQKEWLKQSLMHHQPNHIWLEKLLF
ncbi:nucleotidyltransferase domain-containing protein [Halobacillus sp. K22]|uniref:nucleotidyltransferase domain-containing protein n=1 Tax=Halobacillus sp. K22 TaxID=3457431 RepID=UPI003FCCF39C